MILVFEIRIIVLLVLVSDTGIISKEGQQVEQSLISQSITDAPVMPLVE